MLSKIKVWEALEENPIYHVYSRAEQFSKDYAELLAIEPYTLWTGYVCSETGAKFMAPANTDKLTVLNVQGEPVKLDCINFGLIVTTLTLKGLLVNPDCNHLKAQAEQCALLVTNYGFNIDDFKLPVSYSLRATY